MDRIKVSDESYNSHNMRVLTAGGDFTRFKKNPVMLFQHKKSTRDNLPPGKWKDLQIEGDSIYLTPVFDLEDEFAVQLSGKYERGFLNGTSMSIRIKQLDFDGLNDNQEELYTISSWELREVSFTDIPSNANTVRFVNENDDEVEFSAVVAEFSAHSSNAKPKITPSMDNKNLNALLELSADAPVSEAEAKIKAMKQRIADFEAAEETRRTEAAEALVELAVEQEKILPTAKDHFLSLALKDYESCKQLLEGMSSSKVVSLSDVPKKKANGGSEKVLHNGMTFSELHRQKPDELQRLKTENFTLFNELYKSQYGKDYQT
jgi:phage head maturation protease